MMCANSFRQSTCRALEKKTFIPRGKNTHSAGQKHSFHGGKRFIPRGTRPKSQVPNPLIRNGLRDFQNFKISVIYFNRNKLKSTRSARPPWQGGRAYDIMAWKEERSRKRRASPSRAAFLAFGQWVFPPALILYHLAWSKSRMPSDHLLMGKGGGETPPPWMGDRSRFATLGQIPKTGMCLPVP